MAVFEVYNKESNQLVVRIVDDQVDFILPTYASALEKIPTAACFPYLIKGEKEKAFGSAKEIPKDDPLYAKALKMYFEAQVLTKPNFTTRPSHSFKAIDLNERKVK